MARESEVPTMAMVSLIRTADAAPMRKVRDMIRRRGETTAGSARSTAASRSELFCMRAPTSAMHKRNPMT
jgi:hypothetical protein